MKEIEQAIELLRERPAAAGAFMRPTVEQIVRRALERGARIYGES